LSAMQITLPTAVCEHPVAEAAAPVTAAVNDKPVPEPEAPKKPATDNSHDTPVEIANTEPLTSAPTESGTQGDVVNSLPPVNTNAIAPPSVWQSVPIWLPLLGVIVLGVFIWKGIFFFRLSSKTPDETAATNITAKVQPASDEPVTAPLAGNADAGVIKPRSAPVPDLEIPSQGTRPDGCDGVLLVEGVLDADTPFKRFCFVNTGNINIMIGRGDADIAIEHAAISRNHARIESDGSLLTFSDMGSRNGSFIGDVPCLPGEILYFDADDEIFLGDVSMTIRVVTQEAQWA
ncbi:MAG TPA: FHA domain-containing protein, partial [Xanthomonadales bacterium]